MDYERSFWDAKNINESRDIYLELFDKNLLTHSPLGIYHGHHSLYNAYLQWLEGFPHIKMFNSTFNKVGNLIIWEWSSTSRHEGPFHGLDPTGRQIEYSGKTLYQFDQNEIVNYTCYMDITNVYKQLGFFLQSEEYEGQHILKKNYTQLIAKLMELTQCDDTMLTVKELEILSYWLMGHSSKSIGILFRISPRTVEVHIDHIRCKLLCHSKHDLKYLMEAKKVTHLFYDLYLLIRHSKTKFVMPPKSAPQAHKERN